MKKILILLSVTLGVVSCQNQTNNSKEQPKTDTISVAQKQINDSIQKSDSIALIKIQGSKFVEINGKKQFVIVKGQGSPAIIFVNGKGADHSSYDSVQKNLSKVTLTFAYDRGGLGLSESINKERSIDNMVSELNQILEKESIKPPYILVGHSMGGYIIRYFVNKYPEKVAAMLFLDPAHEDCIKLWRASRTEAKKIQLDSFITVLKNNPNRTAGANAESKHFWTTDEDLVRDKPIPNNIPVTLISSSKPDSDPNAIIFTKSDQEIWVNLHKSWKKEAPQMKHIITDKSGHQIQEELPDLVTKEIIELIKQIDSKKK